MVPGDRRQLVWLTTAEPAGLYCADETDPVAALVCAQLSEGLYGYDPTGAAPIPALASACDPNADLHGLDLHACARASASTTARPSTPTTSSRASPSQWDAEHPLHAATTARSPTFAAWFGGFLNPPASIALSAASFGR